MTGSRSSTAGRNEAAHPVRGVDRHGERPHASTRPRTSGRARCRRGADRDARPRPGSPAGGRPVSVIARISRRPLSSPTGRAPARQNFSPLYCFGLWLAVIITAGKVERPATRSTGGPSRRARGRPRRRPREVIPVGERGGDVGRRESAVPSDHHLRPARDHSANAAPIRRARSSSRSSGTTPRTSYALKMRSRSSTVTNGILRREAADRQAGCGRYCLDDEADHRLAAARPSRRGTTTSPRRGDRWRTRARGPPRSS